VPTAPRNVLKRVLELYAAEGLETRGRPRDGILFRRPQHRPQHAHRAPPWAARAARRRAKQAYSMSAVDEYGKVIDDIYDFAEAMGLEIDGILQEGGAGQLKSTSPMATRSRWRITSFSSNA
jgi:glutamine synthetase